MTKTEAAERLGVSIDAATVQIEQRYRELYQDLKTRLDDAPTPSLKRKYQSELHSLQEAFDTLCPSNQNHNDYPTDTPVYLEDGSTKSQVLTGSPPSVAVHKSRKWPYVLSGALALCILGAITYGAVVHIQQARRQEQEQAEAAAHQKAIDDANATADKAAAQQQAAELKRQQDAEVARQIDEAKTQALHLEQEAQKEADDAARRKQQADAAAAAAARQKQQADAAAAAALAQQQAAQEAQARADAAAQQHTQQPSQDPGDEKPKTARITLAYRPPPQPINGPWYGCSLALRVTIGDKSYSVSSTRRVSGVELGDQDYTISGQIGCPNSGGCQAIGSGSIDVGDGDTFDLVWSNTAYATCSVELDDD